MRTVGDKAVDRLERGGPASLARTEELIRHGVVRKTGLLHSKETLVLLGLDRELGLEVCRERKGLGRSSEILVLAQTQRCGGSHTMIRAAVM